MWAVVSFIRRIRSRVFRTPPADWFLILIIFSMLGLTRLMIIVLPFRVYSTIMGKRSLVGTAPAALSVGQHRRAERLGRLVRKVARVTPWESVCLPQAMVASAILWAKGIPHVTYFGVVRSNEQNKQLLAHAWVKVSDQVITGGGDYRRYTVVVVFARK